MTEPTPPHPEPDCQPPSDGGLREALKELYEFVRHSNDWRPDAPLARKVQTALTRANPPTEPVADLKEIAFRVMLDVVNEWHRQVGIDDVMKTKLANKIADTVATGVFEKAIKERILPLYATPTPEGGEDQKDSGQSRIADGGQCNEQPAQSLSQRPSEFWAGKAAAAFMFAEEIKLRKQLVDALSALLDAVKAEPSMQGRQHIHLGIQVTNALAAATVRQPIWECAARKQSLPEPADCNWPFCGCDPHADKVLEAVAETRPIESAGSSPPAVFADPNNSAPEGDFVLVSREAMKEIGDIILQVIDGGNANLLQAARGKIGWLLMIAAAPNPPMGGDFS